MKNYVIAIDQSTSATKVILFDEKCKLIQRVSLPHQQYYPQAGWVEHDAEEIYENTLKAVKLIAENRSYSDVNLSVAITNQRETIVVWNKKTGKPIYNAIVWQCQRGAGICANLIEQGYKNTIEEKTGLIVDPYFSASGIQWILDNVENARQLAEENILLTGTIDSWLLWKLTNGKEHATDYTNASRTLLFNIKTLKWDEELLSLFTIPSSMMPVVKPCDSVFGESTFQDIFKRAVPIAGIIGDSHGALVGQMCFKSGMGKATYGTGSSVMVNIGTNPIKAADGLVTSIGFSACGETYYAYEGNIHCTGATIKWMKDKLNLIESEKDVEDLATSIDNNDGVYLVPAFVGLGAPWWNSKSKAMIYGMTFNTGKAHIVRAGLESIAYQVKDLIDLMTRQAKIRLEELCVDGGPTRNNFLMQFQSDMLNTTIIKSGIEEASALGAVMMNKLALGHWKAIEDAENYKFTNTRFTSQISDSEREKLYSEWLRAVEKAL